eukprot:TRINITY_DN12764_c0_g1_i5.p1 TRINITY_DN12764_c0_g1~~TRINITY_DN12764_c0_g1_i5.p1  ORF type:complete len:422 (+),score=81.97 TRINITY_DN12764_c0_g1_i5:73-1338(+)
MCIRDRYQRRVHGIRMIAKILICLLFAAVHAVKPITKLMYASGELANKGIAHITLDTGETHAFGLLATKIIHRTYNGHFGPINVVAQIRDVSFADVISTRKVEGKDQNIFFFFVAPRSGRETKVCNEKNTTGCGEIYITTSTDKGKTWSPPTSIRRTNMKDAVDRSFPSVAYDRVADTIYMAYATRTSTEFKIAMVKKRSNDSFFSDETVLTIPGGTVWSQPKLAITKPTKGETIFHLSILGGSKEKESVYYVRSTNEKTWSDLKQISDGASKNVGHSNSISALGVVGENDVYLARTSKGVTYLHISKDGGKEWGIPIKVGEKGRIPFTKACGNTATAGVLISIFGENQIEAYKFMYYDKESNKVVPYETPFTEITDLNHIPMFDCAVKDKTLTYAAVSAYRQLVFFAEHKNKLKSELSMD